MPKRRRSAYRCPSRVPAGRGASHLCSCARRRYSGDGCTRRNILVAKTLALIAHDEKKDDMVAFARAHQAHLARHQLYATGTTGQRIMDSCSGLSIRRLKSGPLGGDQQIGALIAEGVVDVLIFFVDPLTPLPHDVDVKALMRLAIVYDIPMALNRATAEVLVQGMGAEPKAARGDDHGSH
ncbi:MAG: methylglyoxal synthase [Rhizobiaceae bacterium]|nr:methylglyoxal synthase [Rhizobiaceae bacterium]